VRCGTYSSTARQAHLTAHYGGSRHAPTCSHQAHHLSSEHSSCYPHGWTSESRDGRGRVELLHEPSPPGASMAPGHEDRTPLPGWACSAPAKARGHRAGQPPRHQRGGPLPHRLFAKTKMRCSVCLCALLTNARKGLYVTSSGLLLLVSGVHNASNSPSPRKTE
jgi:hypothetical protein